MITLDDIQGHWTRDWIRAPGFEDHTTRVHWLQSGTHYADVRVPKDRPDLGGASTLAGQPAEVLLRLLDAEGFAGEVALDVNRVTWQRDINWHGQPDAIDIGEVIFDDRGRMFESGVHEEYTECWRHRDAPVRLSRCFSGGGRVGHLVCIGDAFVIGIGRPDAPPIRPILEVLETGSVPGGTAALFDDIHAFGVWNGRDAIASLATNPLAEGERVLTLHQDRVIWHQTDFQGVRRDIEMALISASP